MHCARAPRILLPLIVLYACSGGGGHTTAGPVEPWEKFRHDMTNTGLATGAIATNSGSLVPIAVDESPISASPAIGLDGNVYVATEGGTLAAFDTTTLTKKWASNVTQCTHGSRTGRYCGDPMNPDMEDFPLGKIVSSPTIYTFNNQTLIFLASTNGTFFTFTIGTDNVPVCTMCFQPTRFDASISSASFVSSPSFTSNAISLNVSGIFVGAEVTINGTPHGKMYALTSDGQVRWQFPRPQDSPIGPVASSPAFGLGGALYFTADENLYALANNGSFNWKFPIGMVQDPTADLAASPATASSTIFTATAAGQLVAVNPDGRSTQWTFASPDDSGFIASIALGAQAPTPTPSATAQPTPTAPPGPTSTATPTVTPITGSSTLFAITKMGSVVVLDAIAGRPVALTNSIPTIAPPVVSSPALSGDLFLVVGGGDGKLYAVNTASAAAPATPPANGNMWPLQLSAHGEPIRSSPAIAADGTIYVGADDGFLYAVGHP